MTDTVFTTPRLDVRRWRPTDIDDLFGVYADARAMRCVGDGRSITRQECEQWLQVTRANHARRGYGMFALELRDTGLLAGFAGIVHPGDPREAEVKYALHRAHWGRGVLRDNGDGSRTQCFEWIAGP